MRRRTKGTGSLRLRGDTWWICYTSRGQKRWENARTSDRSEAERTLMRKLSELGETHAAPGKATVSTLVALVLSDYEFRGLRSADVVRWRADAHVKRLLGPVKADRLRSADIRRYIETRRTEDATDSTINRELAILHRGLALAMREEPPLIHRAPPIPKLREDNIRQGFLEPAQYERLLVAMPERLKCLLVVGYHVGSRLGELRALKWHQVDFDADEIRLTAAQTKGKTARTLPIYGDMEHWLRWQQEESGDAPWVFWWRGHRIGSHLKGWREACTAAGLPGLLFHDLRRSAVRNMVRSGVPENTARRISGHKTASIFARYDVVSGGDLREAGEKLSAYLRARKAEGRPKLKRVK